MREKNTIFIIKKFFDEGFDFLWISKNFICSGNKAKEMRVFSNTLNLPKGFFKISFEGDLKFTSQSAWYKWDFDLESLTFSKPKNKSTIETSTLILEKISDAHLNEDKMEQVVFIKGNENSLFDKKYSFSNGIVKSLSTTSSKEEFENILEEKDLNALKEISKLPLLSTRDNDYKLDKKEISFVSYKDIFYAFYNA